MDAEAEKITIIEGPPPVFETATETWLPSLAEGPRMSKVGVTHLRTFNGPALVERCWRAWHEQRRMHLEYRNKDGLKEAAEILAMRYVEAPEGHLLFLYVRLD